MTDGVLTAIQSATGDMHVSCPWSVFSDPLVRWTIGALSSWRSGNFSVTHPYPSQRRIDAVTHYDAADNRVAAHFMEVSRAK
jgi:hypothetical protein